MTDLDTFNRRKEALRHNYTDLMALLNEGSLIREPKDELARLEAATQELEGALLFRVLCLGDFSTGKSSFINRFLLEQNLLPALAKPTTSLLTCIRHGESLRAIKYEPLVDGGTELTENIVTEDVANALVKWVSAEGIDDASGSSIPVIVESPAPKLAVGFEIVDAPGLNDPNPERMRLTLDYLNQADAVLFFINAMRPWTKYEKDVFEGEVLSRDLLGRLFIVVNYWDQIEVSQRDEVLSYIADNVQLSLAKNKEFSAKITSIPILPVSSKTGENEDLITKQVWDVLSARKSEDVLSLRINRFNQELSKYDGVLAERLKLLGLDSQGRSRKRDQLQQELKDYEQQCESFLADLKRLLLLDFQEYLEKHQSLYESLANDVRALEVDLKYVKTSEEFNKKFPQAMSRLRKSAVRRLETITDEFLSRIQTTIEKQKANIGVLPSYAVTIEEYVMGWHGLDGNRFSDNAYLAAGGAGVASLLLGAGTLWQTAAVASTVGSSGFFSTVGVFFVGAPAAASSFMVLGVPALAVGCLLVATALYTRNTKLDELCKQISDACAEVADGIDDDKWATIAQLKANLPKRIDQICKDVDSDINRACQERLDELDLIQGIEDEGAALIALRERLSVLPLRVNQ
jgi:GTPase SAR1 family protein